MTIFLINQPLVRCDWT